jgi:hypothetical protein
MGRSNWMGMVSSDRPREILPITKETEAKLSGVKGFNGKNEDGTVTEEFHLTWKGAVNPVVETEFPNVPIGTVIFTPESADKFCFVRKAKSDPAVAGDFKSIDAA